MVGQDTCRIHGGLIEQTTRRTNEALDEQLTCGNLLPGAVVDLRTRDESVAMGTLLSPVGDGTVGAWRIPRELQREPVGRPMAQALSFCRDGKVRAVILP